MTRATPQPSPDIAEKTEPELKPETVNRVLGQVCDHWTPEQKRKAEEALEQHRAHEENQIMNEALFGIPCAGYVEVPPGYDPRGRAG